MPKSTAAESVKNQFRRQIIDARRKRITSVNQNTLDTQAIAISQATLQLVQEIDAQVVASFDPMLTEPDVSIFNQTVQQLGLRLLLPEVRRVEGVLLAPKWHDGSQILEANALAEADFVLVPALAVDGSGTRLGRGGGWYDRALSHCFVTEARTNVDKGRDAGSGFSSNIGSAASSGSRPSSSFSSSATSTSYSSIAGSGSSAGSPPGSNCSSSIGSSAGSPFDSSMGSGSIASSSASSGSIAGFNAASTSFSDSDNHLFQEETSGAESNAKLWNPPYSGVKTQFCGRPLIVATVFASEIFAAKTLPREKHDFPVHGAISETGFTSFT